MARAEQLPGWRRPDRGVLFVISGPSGVGKSTLIKEALAQVPDLAFSVSATTRAPRPGEQDGVDYHFLSHEAFEQRVEAGAFLEFATVYDRSYGTLRGPTDEALDAGASLVLDIDVKGARQVRARLADAVSVMIVPPDLAALEARLRARATDPPEVVERRMAMVAEQVGAVGEYDYVVVNDDLATAHRVFQGVLFAEMSRVRRRGSVVRRVAAELRARRPQG